MQWGAVILLADWLEIAVVIMTIVEKGEWVGGEGTMLIMTMTPTYVGSQVP